MTCDPAASTASSTSCIVYRARCGLIVTWWMNDTFEAAAVMLDGAVSIAPSSIVTEITVSDAGANTVGLRWRSTVYDAIAGQAVPHCLRAAVSPRENTVAVAEPLHIADTAPKRREVKGADASHVRRNLPASLPDQYTPEGRHGGDRNRCSICCDRYHGDGATPRVSRFFYRMRTVYRAGCGFASRCSLNPFRR